MVSLVSLLRHELALPSVNLLVMSLLYQLSVFANQKALL